MVPGEMPWLHRLAPADAQEALVPVSSSESVAAATALLGSRPVAWAIQVGHDLAVRVIQKVPEVGGGDGPFETVRMGTESMTLRALILLVDPSAGAAITEEALLGDRDFARRRIGLEKVLRGMRIGHAELALALMEECHRLASPDVQSDHCQRISKVLFELTDDFSTRMTEEYLAEHDRWVASGAAAREELVRLILAGEPPADQASRSALGSPLEGRQLAVIAWCDHQAAAAELQQVVLDFLRAERCAATLLIPIGRTRLWAWGASPARIPDGEEATAVGAAGLHVVCGSVRYGPTGFRRSHEEAELTKRVVHLNPHYSKTIVRHHSVRLPVLLSSDIPATRGFVKDTLGPLSVDDTHAERLRETLRHYLRSGRSLAAAAASVHVARNTVTYRIKRAQELIGGEVGDRLTEVLAALETAHVLGPAVLQPASDFAGDQDATA